LKCETTLHKPKSPIEDFLAAGLENRRRAIIFEKWLGTGKTLQHFFSLRKEILSFLNDKVEGTHGLAIQLGEEYFTTSLAF